MYMLVIIMYVVQRRRIIIIIYIRRHLAHQPGDPVSATLCLPFAFPPTHTKTVFSSFLLRSGGRLRKLMYELAWTRYAAHHNARISAPKRSQAFRIHVASARGQTGHRLSAHGRQFPERRRPLARLVHPAHGRVHQPHAAHEPLRAPSRLLSTPGSHGANSPMDAANRRSPWAFPAPPRLR